MTENVTVSLADGNRNCEVEGTRVHFSVHQCFSVMDAASRELMHRLADYLLKQRGVVLWDGPLLLPLLEVAPKLRRHVRGVIVDKQDPGQPHAARIPTCDADGLPSGTQTVFLCQTRAVGLMTGADSLPPDIKVIGAEVLLQLAFDVIPMRAWTPVEKNIYPIKLPGIRFTGKSDLILIDCPARNLALMPNGLGYVHNALKKAGLNFETFDLDIVAYHRYHIRRLFDEGGKIVLPSGREMPNDPWQAENYDLWDNAEVLAYLAPILDEAADAIIAAKPRILALSIQQCSEKFSRLLVNRVKAGLPDVLILVGGFSCYNADIGLKAFPEAHYMCIGESDLTVAPLVRRLVSGERPADLPGIVSRFDTPDRMFIPAPMQHNLDQVDFPRYEWFDLSIYRNFNGYQLVPVIASRGCRWSRCTFCAERFYWRIRSAQNFVDELEWLVDQGCNLFMFNESDLNGMPEKLLEICDEIIRRGINVRLTGQLRIQKTSDRPFYDKLRAAGFVVLRFGVDAFSANALRLQKKGYTVDMVRQNLRDCWEAGIYTEVNWVIGVPGETEADCEEGIKLILENQQYIGRLANINPLILVNGSVYWIDPERHGIRFQRSKEELYAENPRYVPADAWHSVDPYIDAQVRKEWFEHIVVSLYEAGFQVGPWAERVIADVKDARDRARAGGSYAPEPIEAADQPVLTQTLPTHKVFRYKNRSYAIPLALGEVDLTQAEAATLPGVMSADDETELLVEIEHAKSWANSRGQYDAQARQRIAGSLYRAGSVLGDKKIEAVLAPRPDIVLYNGEYIAIERDKVKALGSADAEPLPSAAEQPEPKRPLYRRVARAVLPKEALDEIRAVWPSRQHAVAWPTRLSSPWRVVKAIATSAGAQGERGVAPDRASLPETNFAVVRVLSKGVQPQLMTSLNGYNLVEYDGLFYGLPRELDFDWGDPSAVSLPGVILTDSAQDLIRKIRERTQAPVIEQASESVQRGTGAAGEILKVPKFLGSLEDYNIISYEGFIYGLPRAMGDIDLTEIDAIGLDGVIRDVSRQVVENEILELVAMRQQAAE